MKIRIVALAIAATAILTARPTSARDDLQQFPIRFALEQPEARTKLDRAVKLYFGKAPHPAVAGDLGDFKTNKKTRSFGRGDQEACDWAFLSAVMQLQDRARALRADAVVEIESCYKNQPFVSDTEYQCGAGGFAAGVALRGRFVKFAGPGAAPPRSGAAGVGGAPGVGGAR
jgi:hypothetical protein